MVFGLMIRALPCTLKEMNWPTLQAILILYNQGAQATVR